MSGKELPENELIRLLGLPFTNTLDWTSYIESIALSAARKIGSLFRARAYLPPESILYYINQPFAHVWSTVVISGQVHLALLLDLLTKYRIVFRKKTLWRDYTKQYES